MLRMSLKLGVLFCCVVSVTGCGAPSDTKILAKATGVVSYKDAPLASGDVNFYNDATGTAAKAPLDTSGKFDIADKIEVGKYKVFITPTALMSTGGEDGSAPPTQDKVEIPEKYTKIDTTDLVAEVKSGENKIELKLE